MKNFSNKKINGKNNNAYKKKSDIDYHKNNINSLEKKERFLNNSSKNKNVENSNKKDKNNTFSALKRRPIFKSNSEFSNKNLDNHKEFTIKRNFDDWIWGKHSVYEALSSDRAINRVWCTSEIFSSDKFYILLKDLKTKGEIGRAHV